MDQLSDVHNRYEAQTSINQVNLKHRYLATYTRIHIYVGGLIFIRAREAYFYSMLLVHCCELK